MAKGILYVESSAAAGRDDEYNTWYNDVHLPELCQIPGIVRAARYAVHDGAIPADPSRRKYVAIYELEADDLSDPVRELQKRGAAGQTTRSTALETDPPPVLVLLELVAEHDPEK